MIQNNCRTRTPVDSFVQLNLKPSIDITLEDYKKVKFSFLSSLHTHYYLKLNAFARV
jgi:hypothetical protein